jgi:molecular chaperone DnaJ
MRDYYKILGAEENISPPELKKLYRKLAHQYHPDKNEGDEAAAERFKKISDAYSILGDPQKRAEYDARRHGGGMNASSGFGGWGNVFSSFFGNGPQARPAPEPQINLNISLNELKGGSTERLVAFDNIVKCDGCLGKGGDDVAPCTPCNGQGRVHQSSRQGNSFFQRIRNCSVCQGRGKIILNPCAYCGGEGKVLKREVYHINIQCTAKE